jgi:hypothetical protein
MTAARQQATLDRDGRSPCSTQKDTVVPLDLDLPVITGDRVGCLRPEPSSADQLPARIAPN